MAGARLVTIRPRRVGGLIGLLLALSVPWWPTIVVGQATVPPPAFFAVLSVVALVLLWAVSRWGLRLLALVSVLVVGLGLAFNALTTTTTVLPEQGPQGCRVVVTEISFLMGGRGSIGTVANSIGIVNEQVPYQSDDGGRPFTEADYTLVWEGRTAHVVAPGSRGAPAWPSTHTITC